jgi:hypothetical protein
MPRVTTPRAILAIVLFVVSMLGYVIGVPLITQEGCLASGGIYAEGICYPSGTTFQAPDPNDETTIDVPPELVTPGE